MSSPQQPNSAIPKPLPDDDDDVSWALQTAAVQWQRGAYQDALVWLRRAAESAIELSKWSRAADLNATASRLEKQLSKGGPPMPPPPVSSQPPPVPTSSQAPSAPPRNAMLPSFPAPSSATPASSFGRASASRPSSGISSLPPLPGAGFTSRPPSGRSSVVIDVEESELELSDEEIRELESHESLSDIPNGARPSHAALPASMPPSGRGSSLPAFELESSRPLPESLSPARSVPSRTPFRESGLPSFALEPSARPPATGAGFAPSEVPTRTSGRPSATGLPSFPLEPSASSLPPVSKWPRHGSPGTSHLPPSPALPSFESRAPSRPFADDGDDGVPGIEDANLDEPILEEQSLESPEFAELEPLDPEPGQPSSPPLEHLDLVELDGPRSTRNTAPRSSALGHLPARSGRPAARPRPSNTPLPPALPEGRSLSNKPLLVRSGERPPAPPPPVPPPAPSAPAHPVSMPRATPTGSIEPRMPKRTLSYASPLDFGSRPPSPAGTSPSNRVTSSAPTVKQIEVAEPISVAPPTSTRSLAPEDLPTVSSPSLSRPPPANLGTHDAPASDDDELGEETPLSVKPGARSVDATEVRPESTRRDSRMSSSPPGERRRLTFRFEEPAPPLSKSSEAAPDTDRSHAGPRELSASEEPLAVLPPVTMRPSAGSARPSSNDVYLSGVRLADVRGFADLPPSAHEMLARRARIEALATGEEASFFSVALVLEGWVGLMPAIADCACATAVVGEVVFTEGTLTDGLMLRVVAGQDDVVVATWDSDAIAEATKECPWVADDLRLLADGFQALAGACLGPLGDRLDDSLRSIVTSRCEIRTLLPGEQLCAAGKPVPGMHIIGGGSIELVDENARVAKAYATGEFLFAPQVLAGGVAPYSARAGSKGALVLFAPRMAAHELLVSVPPLLEILAD